eukprot:15393651-Alexandrium_andersonii.AAC.1
MPAAFGRLSACASPAKFTLTVFGRLERHSGNLRRHTLACPHSCRSKLPSRFQRASTCQA